MRMLGGEFKPAPQGRWTNRIAVQLNTLKSEWDVPLHHAVLLAPRTDKQVRRPVHCGSEYQHSRPFHGGSNDPDDSTGKYYAQARSLASSTFSTGASGMNAIKVRSNNAKLFAWSSLFGDWHRIETNPLLYPKQKQAQQTALMRSQVKRIAPSPRVRTLVGLLKMIIAKKERFVIIADRLFLPNLAYAVPPQTI
jgi:hypothetical protein